MAEAEALCVSHKAHIQGQHSCAGAETTGRRKGGWIMHHEGLINSFQKQTNVKASISLHKLVKKLAPSVLECVLIQDLTVWESTCFV